MIRTLDTWGIAQVVSFFSNEFNPPSWLAAQNKSKASSCSAKRNPNYVVHWRWQCRSHCKPWHLSLAAHFVRYWSLTLAGGTKHRVKIPYRARHPRFHGLTRRKKAWMPGRHNEAYLQGWVKRANHICHSSSSSREKRTGETLVCLGSVTLHLILSCL